MELTNRLKRIKQRLYDEEFTNPGIWYFKDKTILTSEEIIKEPLVVRKAMAYEYIAKNLPVYIKEDELIVGNPNQNSVGFGMILPNYATEEELKTAKSYSLDINSLWGHHPPDWNKVITKGLKGIIAEIYEAMELERSKTEPERNVLDEYRAMIISLNAVIYFAHRHADVALRDSMNEKDPARKIELYKIHNICQRVPEYPAATYYEALQSYWFTYCIINSGGEFVPLANGDQFLYPFYKRDLEEKRFEKEMAIDLTGSFLAKCNEKIILDTRLSEVHTTFGVFSQGVVPEIKSNSEETGGYETGGYDQRTLKWCEEEDINSDANYNYGQSGNDWLMNLIVGGQDKDGNDSTNELSYLIIDLMSEMQLLMPTLSVRIHNNSPEEFLDKIAEVLLKGKGEPAIYFDNNIIPGLLDIGIPLEEARSYSNDGCWEVLIPGKSYFSLAHVQNLQCLEWVLTRGESLLRNNFKEGLDTGEPTQFKDWEEFYQAYLKQVKAKIDFHCSKRLENLGMSSMIAPDPLMSALMDDCIKKGRDMTQDGCRYIFHIILITGLANTVDSLAVIKKLVYEEKSVAIRDLIHAIRNNWQGYERLRARVINQVPKFGNDDDYVDEIAVRLMKDFENRVDEWRCKQDKVIYPSGIGTFENYAILGRGIGASPDGRLAKDALAPNYSPFFGRDFQGPTAVLKSVTKPELLNYYCGCPLDISINAGDFAGEVGLQRLKALINTFGELGGQILTVGCNSIKELKDAKENPEKHKNLMVRMGGLSAYFIAMPPAQQDNIIRKYEKGAN